MLAQRLAERIRIPAPALLLVAAAVVVKLVPALPEPSSRLVERLVTVALLCILFDGGMHIGWTRFRAAAGVIGGVGVVGTVLTTAGAATLLHVGFGLPWFACVIVATAVAPTDPAVVFSVLGRTVIDGRSATILEGESGANDPVGIALMTSLLAAGALSPHAFGEVGSQFALQMVVGAAIGVVGGFLLTRFMRLALPSESLYPLRTLAVAFALYGAATLAHGSGFLAVFVAGIAIGDVRAPYKNEIGRFHSALAGLGEIVAFIVLGLSVNLAELAHRDVWLPGLVVGAVLALVIRPVAVGLCLIPVRLPGNERTFVLLAGLKGAVPILLGELLRQADVPGAERLYGIVVVVVVFSVVVQGGLTPTLARRLRLPLRVVDPSPWSAGLRLRDDPRDAHRVTVQPGSPADGRPVGELDGLWVSMLVRSGTLVPLNAGTMLRAGDDLLVLADPVQAEGLGAVFDG